MTFQASAFLSANSRRLKASKVKYFAQKKKKLYSFPKVLKVQREVQKSFFEDSSFFPQLH